MYMRKPVLFFVSPNACRHALVAGGVNHFPCLCTILSSLAPCIFPNLTFCVCSLCHSLCAKEASLDELASAAYLVRGKTSAWMHLLVPLERHIRIPPGGPSCSSPRGQDLDVRRIVRASCAPGTIGLRSFARARFVLTDAQASCQGNRSPAQGIELYTGYQPYCSPLSGDQ